MSITDAIDSRRAGSDPAWPALHERALQGLAGELVGVLAPCTEADPAGLLGDLLASFGNAVGATPHALAGGVEHPPRLNVVLVGETARARKGTARAIVRRVMASAEPAWAATQVRSGLASGEGLIAAVADPALDADGNPVGVNATSASSCMNRSWLGSSGWPAGKATPSARSFAKRGTAVISA
jgi:hypothetical protein